ncbi:hypothetical protein CEUSTIGMA_g3334.t1 [Chlamydomonas eustigma]|uniref:NADP-dependent oxidoreductase domain-containing protein n=1 Tax=Chlamydomonas eustigma TaxID=1157962 RepID=A0A250WYI2_9CHLO|nr:hypothetical protein CEUSTIGMA_g3334.t1 [Chlamydomonas eustigma]|eukprot:GAX75891.1 hypothetical protein CEUSTIGMA_g3334.t1 [Chlamydomonas eustigma]
MTAYLPNSNPMLEEKALGTGNFLGYPDMNKIGLGLAALGRPGYINVGHDRDIASKSRDDMQKHCAQVLDEAHALGIRYFDAARSYGEAEAFLSAWILSRGHVKAASGENSASIVVGSKWGYTYTAGWRVDNGGEPHEVKEHTISNLLRQSQLSKELLGTHMQLYQIHSATLESGVLENIEVLKELERIKKSWHWRIGLSCSGVNQSQTIRKALDIRMADGGMLFDCVQATWNLLEQSAGQALNEAYDCGLDVIVKEGMANGRLLTLHDQSSSLTDTLLAEMASKYDCSVDALALAIVLKQPFQPMVLSGAATIEHLRSNVKALQLMKRLELEDAQNILEALRQDPTMYWQQRAALVWN